MQEKCRIFFLKEFYEVINKQNMLQLREINKYYMKSNAAKLLFFNAISQTLTKKKLYNMDISKEKERKNKTNDFY